MTHDSDNTDIRSLREAVNQHQDEAFGHQSEVIQYVHDVKDALSRLVEKVVTDQEQTSKLCAEARAAIEGHTDSVAASAETEDALRLHVSKLETERDNLQDKVDLFKSKLEEAKSQLRKMADGADASQNDDNARLELENRLHEKQLAHEAARSQIAKLEAELASKTSSADELLETRKLLVEVESRAQSAEEARHGAEEQLRAAKSEIDDLKSATANSEEHTQELKDQLESVRSELAARQSEIDEIRGSDVNLKVAVARLEDELQHERATIEQQRASIEELSNAKDAAEEESVKLGQRVTPLSEAVQKHEDTIAALKDQIAKAEQAKEDAEAKANDLRDAARSATDAERDLRKQVEEMEEELALLRPLRPEVRQLHDVTSALEIQLENVRLEKERLESEISTELARGTKSRLAEQLADALKEQETAQEAAKALRREVDVLQDEIAALRAMGDAPPRVDVAFDDIAARQRLGELLLDSGIITAEQLNDVVEDREVHGARGRIGQLFIDKGYATEDTIAQALAHQMEVPFLRIEHNTVHHEAVRLLSERLCEMHTCIPVRIDGSTLVVAMENPMDLIAIENIERASEMTVSPQLATVTDIERAIKLNYRSGRVARA